VAPRAQARNARRIDGNAISLNGSDERWNHPNSETSSAAAMGPGAGVTW
jgi:hypothetical protein